MDFQLYYIFDIKYEFYVYPGGNVEDIRLEWSGPIDIQSTDAGMQINIASSKNELPASYVNLLGNTTGA